MKRIKEELKNTRNFKNMPNVYVPYPLKFALKHDLTFTQTLLFAIIRQYSKLEHKAYTGSIQTLQVTLNVARRTVERELTSLINKKFIEKGVNENGRYVYTCAVEIDKGEVFIPYPLKYAVTYNLTPGQTLIYSIVARYSKLKHKAYTGSVKTLQNALNCSRSAVISALNELIIRGFIIKFKDLSANVTFVDGLSHTPGKTEEELKLNARWVEENGPVRFKLGRSKRKKDAGPTYLNENKVGVHFENERNYKESELEDLFDAFKQYKP